jgi:hypothetical protein
VSSSAPLTRVSSFAQAICGWTRPPRSADLEMLTRVLAAEQHPPDFHAVTLRPASWILRCRPARVHGRRMCCPPSRSSRASSATGGSWHRQSRRRRLSPGSSSAKWSTAAPAAVTSSEHRPIADQGRCQGMSPVRHARPCGRLSRSPRRVVTPATTTGPPPHPRPSAGIGPARRRAGCPAGRATADGSHVHHAIDRSGRCPALLRQHRHAYAAALQRGLPTGTGTRLRS